jgi:hypothetical protein
MSIKAIAFALSAFLCAQVFAQDPVNGRLLYVTPFGAGTPSCSTGTCHGPDPRLNINRIQNGTTPADIYFAIERYGVMAFLQGRVSSAQVADLAAYIANPSAAAEVRAASLSITSQNFDTIFVGQASRSTRISLLSSGNAALTISNVSVDTPNFVITTNSCAVNTVLHAGATCDIDLAYVPTSASSHTGQLVVSHNGQGGNSVVALNGKASALPPNARLMVEYRMPALDYYFITSRPNEQAGLDASPDFRRTGTSFPVYVAQEFGTASIVRYYFHEIAKQRTRGSHFYTLLAYEIAALNQSNPSNIFVPRLAFNEGVDSYAAVPLALGANGSCAANLQPVYRLFRGNTRFPDDPNHRFTSDRRTYDEIVAAGWDGEGVVFCVLAPAR